MSGESSQPGVGEGERGEYFLSCHPVSVSIQLYSYAVIQFSSLLEKELEKLREQ